MRGGHHFVDGECRIQPLTFTLLKWLFWMRFRDALISARLLVLWWVHSIVFFVSPWQDLLSLRLSATQGASLEEFPLAPACPMEKVPLFNVGIWTDEGATKDKVFVRTGHQTWHTIPSTLSTRQTWHSVPSTLSTRQTWHSVPSTQWHPVPSTLSTRLSVPGTQYPVRYPLGVIKPGTQYPVLSTQYSVPSTQYPARYPLGFRFTQY